jgi:hypothetical protein
MNNKKVILIMFIVCLFSTGISLFLYKQNDNTSMVIQQDSKAITLQSIIQAQFEIENKSLVVNSRITDSLMKYVGDNMVLVLRFDQHSCDICKDNAIADLLSLKDNIDSQNVLIIFSTDSRKDVTILNNQIKNGFNILSIEEGDIKFEGMPENLPIHFFVLDSNLAPFCIYFYDPEFPELNKKYLDIVYRRFLKRESKGKFP